MEELIQSFSFERVSKSGAKFDPEKTKWFNQQYLRMKPDDQLAELFVADIKDKIAKGKINEKDAIEVQQKLSDPAYLASCCRLIKEKAHFIAEFWDMGSYFFLAPTQFDAEVVKKRWNEQAAKFFSILKDKFKVLKDFNAVETEAEFKKTAEELAISPGSVMQMFRVCISGAAGGPVLFDIAALLGREVVIERLERALKTIKN
jgi:glutamyl-tRNA synthetase